MKKQEIETQLRWLKEQRMIGRFTCSNESEDSDLTTLINQLLIALPTHPATVSDEEIRGRAVELYGTSGGSIYYKSFEDGFKSCLSLLSPEANETVTCECGRTEPLENMRMDDDANHTCDKCYISFLEDKWVSVENPPELGGEYNVVWNLEDNEYPTVTTMEYDKIKNTWTDIMGAGLTTDKVLYWTELPKPPKNIPKNIFEIKELKEPFFPKSLDDFERKVYGQCPHGENMINCSKCTNNH